MTALGEIIHAEVAARGAIPFRRFMELALYCPDLGFYEAEEDRVGRGGDFFTSVSVGSLFGELLACEFSSWAKAAGQPLRLVEAGAHGGQLAADVLGWLQTNRPDDFAHLEYVLAEPSARRRGWQERRLAAFAGRVKWVTRLEDAAADGFTVIFANELLDAFPLHRLGWDAARREWFEWGVGAKDGRFDWVRLPLALSPDAAGLPTDAALLDVLPDGFSVECCPAAAEWWAMAAKALRSGRLVTFDYGHDDGERFLPHRPAGTLRGYRDHRAVEDLLADPGQQDLTAHVDFPGLRDAGERAGLRTESFMPQGRWLTQVMSRALAAGELGEWTAPRTRQFQTLTHPQHLGARFRVLVQSRGGAPSA